MTPVAAQPTTPPNWVADSKILQEARAFLRTFRLVVNHPWAFCSQWAQGQAEAMNPLTFFAIAAGLRAATISLLRWGDEKSAAAIVDGAPALFHTPVGPYLVPVAMGLYLHFVSLRQGRKGWQLTLGAVLFAEGSFSTVLKLFFMVVVTPRAGGQAQPLFAGVAFLVVLLDGVIVAPFIAGAHQRSTWSMLGWCLSFYVALIAVFAIVFSQLR